MAIELKAQMEEDLKRIQEKLFSARAKAEEVNLRVYKLEIQESALEAAIRIMNGDSGVQQGLQAAPQMWKPVEGGIERLQQIPQNGKANIVMVDGMEYEIPEGFELGKNSFGETAIIQKGTTMTAMAEPSNPTSVAKVIAPAEVSMGFDRPEDLL